MTALVTPSIAQLSPYQVGKPIEELQRETGVSDVIKLASNENPLGPSPLAIEAARKALADVHRYPDGAGYALREAIASFHRVGFDEVLHGNGSNELLELIVRTFTTSEHHVVFGVPGFSMYPVIAAAHGVPFTAVPTEALTHRASALLDAVRPDTRVLIVDNPNNPTGTYMPVAEVEQLLKEAPAEVIVVMDEAYFEYAEAADYPNSLKLRQLRERLFVLRTFSKAYGLAGLRVGYGIGPAELVGYMNRIRAPFNVGLPSQAAARAALQDAAHLERTVRLNAEERGVLTLGLEALGLKVAPSQANFVLVQLGQPAAPVYRKLLERGVICRPLPSLPEALRITAGTAQQNQRLLKALTEVIEP